MQQKHQQQLTFDFLWWWGWRRSPSGGHYGNTATAWQHLTFAHLAHTLVHGSKTLVPITVDFSHAAACWLENLLDAVGWQVILAKATRLMLHLHKQSQDRVRLWVEDVTLVHKLALAVRDVRVIQVLLAGTV